ncbi:MAG: hypothetical protein HYW89_04020 [Candidatus Sungiibacteriota bacterium]|uniref:shikimate dehydrogenase (NADP(+)) n=1 Tax=Candidatus Sungiibacteriota bacterium TaxID=2750080 RepID=A0A7T5UQF5_9BACT|nr:MAG: hypothetical protein HYW89_04020 [Candidatus Sungbacteria bacterium]
MEENKTETHEKSVIARELWFQENEKEFIAEHSIGATIRAGDRTAETTDPKGGYREGGFVTLKIQKADGSFDPLETTVVVYSAKKKVLGEIKPEDLEGTPLSQKTKTALIEKLTRLYGRDFTDNDTVTIVRFEYADDLKEAGKKILASLQTFAQNDLLELKNGPFRLAPEYKPSGLTPENIKGRPLSFIIGEQPSEYAVSPLMWNAEFKMRGSNGLFLPVDIAPDKKGNLKEFIDKIVEIGNLVFRVLTITNPYKIDALQYFKNLQERYPDRVDLSEDALRIGATNQILIGPDNKFYVINSDGRGMANSIEEFLSGKNRGNLEAKHVGLVGAGGAARGIAYEVAKRMGPHGLLTIFNRTQEKAVALKAELSSYLPQTPIEARGLNELPGQAKEQEIIISSITEGDPLSDSGVYKTLPRGILIVDANYGPKSIIEQKAHEAGRDDLDIHDGAGMVVEGYIIASQELSRLWKYEVSREVYREIGFVFGYRKRAASS